MAIQAIYDDTYTYTDWAKGDVLTAEKLNKLEAGVWSLYNMFNGKQGSTELDSSKKIANQQYVDTKIEAVNTTINNLNYTVPDKADGETDAEYNAKAEVPGPLKTIKTLVQEKGLIKTLEYQDIPKASGNTFGVIKAGTNLTATDGNLSVIDNPIFTGKLIVKGDSEFGTAPNPEITTWHSNTAIFHANVEIKGQSTIDQFLTLNGGMNILNGAFNVTESNSTKLIEVGANMTINNENTTINSANMTVTNTNMTVTGTNMTVNSPLKITGSTAITNNLSITSSVSARQNTIFDNADYNLIIGLNNSAYSSCSLSVIYGQNNQIQGLNNLAGGNSCAINTNNSVAIGVGSVANRDSQFVFGNYNAFENATSPTTKGTYIEIVGNGTNNSLRSNARTLDWDGNERLNGILTAAGLNITNNGNSLIDLRENNNNILTFSDNISYTEFNHTVYMKKLFIIDVEATSVDTLEQIKIGEDSTEITLRSLDGQGNEYLNGNLTLNGNLKLTIPSTSGTTAILSAQAVQALNNISTLPTNEGKYTLEVTINSATNKPEYSWTQITE